MNTASGSDLRIATERLSDQLAGRLQALIDRGELKPTDRLPTEQALAEQHGVSRTVVREAVSRLKSTGLLVSRQGSGVFVAPRADRRPLVFDPGALDSPDAVMQIVEVRRALDAEAAAQAAVRADADGRARIRQALAAIDDAVAAGHDGVDEDMAFHRAVAGAAGNPQFMRVLGFLAQVLRDAMTVTRANEARSPAAMAQVRREHQAIADAIEAGDAAAARRAATRHMVQAARRIEQADATVRRAFSEALSPRTPSSKETTT
jgi:GntR family transcriptional regulator, transcriptional repressor for pyruvate dehydrogenase complex